MQTMANERVKCCECLNTITALSSSTAVSTLTACMLILQTGIKIQAERSHLLDALCERL